MFVIKECIVLSNSIVEFGLIKQFLKMRKGSRNFVSFNQDEEPNLNLF